MTQKKLLMGTVILLILMFSLLESVQAGSSVMKTTRLRATRDSLTAINNKPVLQVNDLHIILSRKDSISQRQTTRVDSPQCIELKTEFSTNLNALLNLLIVASEQSASGYTCPIGKCPLNSEVDDLISKLAEEVQQIKMCKDRSVICQKMSFISNQMGVRETALFAKIAAKMGIENGFLEAILMESPLYQFSNILSSFLAYARGELC